MTADERANAILATINELLLVEIVEKREQLRRAIADQIREAERLAGERAADIVRLKTAEATDALLSKTSE